MDKEYRKLLFDNYSSSHVNQLDSSFGEKIAWFKEYVENNYLQYFSDKEINSNRILDIGCNRGYLLKVFSDFGYKHLYGIDLSSEDVIEAQKINPNAHLECVDAFEFLAANRDSFDVIIIKAVLEHVSKEKTQELLLAIQKSLKANGVVIVDVPNMDWLFASHERYMDFTHEAGFTKESIGQLMRPVFNSLEIATIDHYRPVSMLGRLKKTIGRFLLGKLFEWADPQGAENPIWCRSIVGVGRK